MMKYQIATGQPGQQHEAQHSINLRNQNKSHCNFRSGSIVALLMTSVLAFGQPANAATEAEVNAIIKSLAPIAGQTATRGYNQGSSKRASTVIIHKRNVVIDHRYAVDVEVYFPFGSARLTKRARGQLTVLGQALASKKLKQHSYVIGGHTDAKGSNAYNRDLSLRRAMAVKDFLIMKFPIEPSRLIVVGWGESALKDPGHPYAAINRRVEAVLVVPAPVTAAKPQASSVKSKRGNKTGSAKCTIHMLRDPRNPQADLDDFTSRRQAVCNFPDARQ